MNFLDEIPLMAFKNLKVLEWLNLNKYFKFEYYFILLSFMRVVYSFTFFMFYFHTVISSIQWPETGSLLPSLFGS